MAMNKELAEVLDDYLTERDIMDLGIASETFSLERFFLQRPDFVGDAVEYYPVYKPTDGVFSSFFMGISVMDFPMGSMYALSKIVGSAYGLEPKEPIIRNSDDFFLNWGAVSVLDYDSLPEKWRKFKQIMEGEDFAEMYLHGKQALIAGVEKMARGEQLGAMAEQYLAASLDGFDFINYYDPLFKSGSDVKTEVLRLQSHIHTLKQNGLMLIQCTEGFYPLSKVREGLETVGISPVIETNRPSPFMLEPRSVVVYKKPQE